jgi:PAS domain S-box-containing protein
MDRKCSGSQAIGRIDFRVFGIKMPLTAGRPSLPRERDIHGQKPSATDFLFGGGEMGALVRAMDWGRTPLGPIARWPQSLRTSVSLCISSNFPISLIWGPQRVQIYNDGYWPICGAKHPHAMGQDFAECWASAWPVIGAAFEQALNGQATYLENQSLFLDRLGYLEETCFTFSFSPIRDETGKIGGLFHPVNEVTVKMLSERRVRALRSLAQHTAKAETLDDVLHLATQALAESSLDLSFLLAYRITPGTQAHLIASTGLPRGTAASPDEIDWINQPDPVWPFAHVTANGVLRVDGVAEKLAGLACGPHPEAPRTAFLVPLTAPGAALPCAILVAGVSARLPINEMYVDFLSQVGASVVAAIANALAFEQARQRAEALAAIDAAKTAFFTNISHEFRTPLTLILGPVEDALADASAALPSAQRARLDVARRNARRLLKLVNALLEFSRVEAGRATIEYRRTDLADFTRELTSNFESVCARSGLKLRVDCPELAAPVFVDRHAWETIVLNLLSNAIKFTFAGEVAVSLRQVDSTAVLTVRDTGTGIPVPELPRMFERFHRVTGARGRSIEGSGIGLALTAELVKQHGGTIEVSSVVGQGTEFRVSLPIGSDHLPKDRVHAGPVPAASASKTLGFVEEALSWLPDTDRPENPLDAPRAAPPPQTGPASLARVLLADDNADMRGYVKRMLEEAGCLVQAVVDGAAALVAARALPRPDIIISDVMMPNLDGFGLLRALRADPKTAHILVILLSARAGPEARVEGLAAGADDYIVKPFGAREMIARVEGALRLAAVRREAIAREHAARTEMVLQRLHAERDELTQDVCERDRQLAGLSQESERSAALLDAIITSTPEPIYAKDRAGRFLLANGSALALLGKTWADVQGRTDADMLDDQEQAAMLAANDQRIMQSGETETIEEVVGGRNGHSRVWLSTKTPLRATDGEIIGLVGVSLEITERKRDENRRELMIHELNHRVKNTLATVQAIASETMKGADPAMLAALNGRLMALSVVHDALTREGWHSLELRDVVAGALAPFGGAQGERFEVIGPPVALLPRAAVAIAMGLNELATNATKYGALLVEAGRVSVVWDVSRGDDPSFHMKWTEYNGPPVIVPKQRSFGTDMIEGVLAGDLAGNVTIHFDPSGVSCVIDAPLDEVEAKADDISLPLVGRS